MKQVLALVLPSRFILAFMKKLLPIREGMGVQIFPKSWYCQKGGGHSASEKGRMRTFSFVTIFSIEKCSVRLG